MWVRLDDGFPDHPKVLGLSDRAFRVHVTALCYSARFLTDGRVPGNLAPKVVANELVRRGLWEAVNGEYVVHDWQRYNPTAEEIALIRKNRAERQRRYRDRRRDSDGDSDGDDDPS